MKFLIRCINNTTTEIEVEGNNPNEIDSRTLRQEVINSAFPDGSLNNLRLIFMGQVLRDGVNISEYGILNGSIIHAVLRPVQVSPIVEENENVSEVNETTNNISLNGSTSQLQNLGNGVYTLSIDASSAGSISPDALMSSISQMLSSSLGNNSDGTTRRPRGAIIMGSNASNGQPPIEILNLISGLSNINNDNSSGQILHNVSGQISSSLNRSSSSSSSNPSNDSTQNQSSSSSSSLPSSSPLSSSSATGVRPLQRSNRAQTTGNNISTQSHSSGGQISPPALANFRSSIDSGYGVLNSLANTNELFVNRSLLTSSEQLNSSPNNEDMVASALWDLSVVMNSMTMPVTSMSNAMREHSRNGDHQNSSNRIQYQSQIDNTRVMLDRLSLVSARLSESMALLRGDPSSIAGVSAGLPTARVVSMGVLLNNNSVSNINSTVPTPVESRNLATTTSITSSTTSSSTSTSSSSSNSTNSGYNRAMPSLREIPNPFPPLSTTNPPRTINERTINELSQESLSQPSRNVRERRSDRTSTTRSGDGPNNLPSINISSFFSQMGGNDNELSNTISQAISQGLESILANSIRGMNSNSSNSSNNNNNNNNNNNRSSNNDSNSSNSSNNGPVDSRTFDTDQISDDNDNDNNGDANNNNNNNNDNDADDVEDDVEDVFVECLQSESRSNSSTNTRTSQQSFNPLDALRHTLRDFSNSNLTNNIGDQVMSAFAQALNTSNHNPLFTGVVSAVNEHLDLDFDETTFQHFDVETTQSSSNQSSSNPMSHGIPSSNINRPCADADIITNITRNFRTTRNNLASEINNNSIDLDNILNDVSLEINPTINTIPSSISQVINDNNSDISDNNSSNNSHNSS